MIPHSCDVNKCRGSKFNGVKLKCKKHHYVECLTNVYPEIAELVKHLSFFTPNNTDTTNEQEKKMKLMFGNDSILSYICENCKEEEKGEVNAIKTDNEAIRGENAELKQKITDLEKSKECNRNDETDKGDDTPINFAQLKGLLQTFGDELMKTVRDEMNEMKAINKKHNAEKTNTHTNEQTHNEYTGTTTKNALNAHKDNQLRVHFQELMPPQENKAKKTVYEMHVSKFAPGTTIEAITQHIVEQTDLSPDMFKVEKLIAVKEDEFKMDYVSFKTVTLKHEFYGMIMNPTNWEPNFTIRDFEQNKINANYRPNERKITNTPNERRNTPKYGMTKPSKINNNTHRYNAWDNLRGSSSPMG